MKENRKPRNGRMLAILLSAAMLLNSVSFATPVYAAEAGTQEQSLQTELPETQDGATLEQKQEQEQPMANPEIENEQEQTAVDGVAEQENPAVDAVENPDNAMKDETGSETPKAETTGDEVSVEETAEPEASENENVNPESESTEASEDNAVADDAGAEETEGAISEDEISVVLEENDATAVYNIYTKEDLFTVANDLDGTFKLCSDIVLEEEDQWTPIGADGSPFTGLFDGQGHTVSGVKLSANGMLYSGFFGAVRGTVRNLNVDIKITDAQTAGGLVGFLDGGKVEYCSASGSISGGNDIGGLVGHVYNGSISNSYSKASVTSSSSSSDDGCGGLVGEMESYYGETSVACSYAAGKVVKAGTSNVGGIVGYRNKRTAGKTTIIASFYDYSTTKMGDECRGFGVTTSEMKRKVTFVGWDFDYTWKIDSAKNDGYPYLQQKETHKAYPLSGTGISSDPYLITTEDELAALARRDVPYTESTYYKLGNNIELTSSYWTPIGDEDYPFEGIFDGDGFTVSGLDIAYPGYACEGLFGYVKGTIRKLHVAGVDFEDEDEELASISDAYTAGMLVGCLFDGGMIEYCSSEGSISGTVDIGGLVGICYNSAIKNCYSLVSVSNKSPDVENGCGGLVGDMEAYYGTSSITSSYAAGEVYKVSNDGVGGLIGHRNTRTAGSTPITACYFNTSTTKMADHCRGFGVRSNIMRQQKTFVGWDFENIWGLDAEINDGFPYLKLSGEYQTFDIEGSGTDRDPYIITSEAELAAIARGEYTRNFEAVYKLGKDIELTSDYWTPIGDDFNLFSGTFDGAGHTISGLSIAFPGYDLEGLFGKVTGTVKNLNVSGKISDAYKAGLLTGVLHDGTIDRCSSVGSVSGKIYIGGLVGHSYNASIKNSYSITDVTNTSTSGGDGCGGLVGTLEAYYGVASITSSYAAGIVKKTGTDAAGGLVGFRNTRTAGNTPIIASYYDLDTSLMKDLQKGFGVATEVMKQQRTYANWDFANTWGIDDSKNNGYPYLKLTGAYKKPKLEGSGTTEDPYVIYTEAELASVARGEATNAFSSNYELANDIVLTGDYWTPIGGNGMDAYSGTFDGKGHVISGLKIMAQGFADEGLFGFITTNGVVKNLGVKGTIRNAASAGLVAGTVADGGSIEKCYSVGLVSGDVDTGGLVGHLYNSSVSDSYSKADVANSSSSFDAGCGGLVGDAAAYYNSVSISSSYATGDVTKTGTSNVGGLLGYRNVRTAGSIAVTSCFFNNYNDTDIDKGTYKTPGEMKQKSTYTGWDFDDTWSIDSDKNEGYPYLTAVKVPDPVAVESVSLNKAELSLEVGKTAKLTENVQPTDADNQSVTWSSSDVEVATVANGIVTAVAAGTATITVTTVDGAKTATCTVTVTGGEAETVAVTDVTLNKETLELEVGKTGTLTATIEPSNATNKEMAWSSDDEEVATVEDGVVTAVAEGTATITVTTADNGKTAECVVTVKAAGSSSGGDEDTVAVTGVTLSKTTLELAVGKSETLTITIAPSNATNKKVAWSSDKETVATVADGVVKAIAEGTATITVTTEDGDKTAKCTVTVKAAGSSSGEGENVAVTGITLNKTTLTLEAGKTETLTATVAPSDATNQKVTWSSDKETVATVADGVVKAIAEGTATITVTTDDGARTATCTVTVKSPEPGEGEVAVKGVTLSKQSITLAIGGSESLSAAVKPSNATNKSVTWSSSDEEIATVSSKGLVMAVKAGTATITANASGKTATCEVTVLDAQATESVSSVSLNKIKMVLTVGEMGQLTETVKPDNAKNKAVTWESSKSSVATVDSGLVSAISKGTAIITVKTADGNKTAACTVTVTEASVPDMDETQGDTIWMTDVPDYTYTGSPIQPEVEVFCGGIPLTAGKDYTISYSNNVNAAADTDKKAPTVTVKGTGNYTGTVSKKFNINKISTEDLKLASENFKANAAYTPTVIYVNDDGKTIILKAGTDYTAKYDGKNSKPSKAAGDHTMTISAKSSGNCAGDDVTFEYTVSADSIKSIAKAKATISKMTFGGELPATTVKLGGAELTQDDDYIVVFSNINKKGKGKATFVGINQYSGTFTKTFTVAAVNLKDDANNDIDVYVEPSVEYVKGGAKAAVSVVVNDTVLVPKKDYTVSYTKNTGINSNPTVTIKGKGNYTGTIKGYFTITPKDLCGDNVRIFVSDAQTGKKPTVTIYDTNGKKLSAGSDYKTTIKDGRVTIKAGSKGLYRVSEPIEIAYNTVPKNQLLSSAKLQSGRNFRYTGSEVELEKDWLKVKVGSKVLDSDDFEIIGYVNNIESGTAIAAISGSGDYSGIVFVSFKIGGFSLSGK